MLSQTFIPSHPQRFTHHQPLDVTLVFGQGPVKPLLLEEELSSEQKTMWDSYKTHSLTASEPDFFVIERQMPDDVFDSAQVSYWKKLQQIRQDPDLSDEERMKRLRQMLLTWQQWSRFSLKSMGKQNAVAAGIALLTGMTKRVIVTGGNTLPLWKKEEFQHLFMLQHPQSEKLEAVEYEKQFMFFLKYFIRWPSEAELMADMIMHNFADAYQEKHGHAIENVIHLETESTNTLENITLSLNKFPDLLSQSKKIGFLSADHHLERVALIAHRFQLVEAPNARISAQKLLQGTLHGQGKDELSDLFSFYMSSINPWVSRKIDIEKKLLSGLTTPEYLLYWLGYTFEVNDPVTISETLHRYERDPQWKQAMEEAFTKAGLDFATFTTLDLKKLKEQDESGYTQLREKMIALTTPTIRTIPSLDKIL